MWRGAAFGILVMLLGAWAPAGSAVETTVVLIDCRDHTFTAPNGTGIGNVGRLVIRAAVDNRDGIDPCTASVDVTGLEQRGFGSSEATYDGQPSETCTAAPGRMCTFVIELEWTYCGSAVLMRWHYDVRFDETVVGNGRVDAWTAPTPCDSPVPA